MAANAERLVSKLIRPELKELAPYESARRLFSLSDSSEVNTSWLNANENPYQPDTHYDGNLLNRYPDFQPEPLISAYAKYSGVEQEQVLATRGADEGIELLIRTFCSAGQQIVICPPTYGMYAISAETAGVEVNRVPLIEGFQLDVSQVINASKEAQLIFICSPNNPTGDLMQRDDLVAVLEATEKDTIVVADEAYIEFCSEATVVDLLSRFSNLVILRTLSKAFGLAGLRCGFTLAARDIIDALKKVIAPYPVPAPVANIATEALSAQGLTWMRNCVTELNARRDNVIEQLRSNRLFEQVYSSKTNFVLCKLIESVKAEDVLSIFIENNILLRNQSKQLMLNNTLRISIGSAEEMQAVSELLGKIEQNMGSL